jgi:hypothetical protein
MGNICWLVGFKKVKEELQMQMPGKSGWKLEQVKSGWVSRTRTQESRIQSNTNSAQCGMGTWKWGLSWEGFDNRVWFGFYLVEGFWSISGTVMEDRAWRGSIYSLPTYHPPDLASGICLVYRHDLLWLSPRSRCIHIGPLVGPAHAIPRWLDYRISE